MFLCSIWHTFVIPEIRKTNWHCIAVEHTDRQLGLIQLSGGGGEVLDISLGGEAPHTLTLFKTNIKTELGFLIPCLRHFKLRLQEVVSLSCCVINGNLMCLVSMPKSTEVNIN